MFKVELITENPLGRITTSGGWYELVDTEILGHYISTGVNIALNLRINKQSVEIEKPQHSKTAPAWSIRSREGGGGGSAHQSFDTTVMEPKDS